MFCKIRRKDTTAISSNSELSRCYIATKSELLYCTGVIKERFQSEDGNMLVFRIENGFYNAVEDYAERICKERERNNNDSPTGLVGDFCIN